MNISSEYEILELFRGVSGWIGCFFGGTANTKLSSSSNFSTLFIGLFYFFTILPAVAGYYKGVG